MAAGGLPVFRQGSKRCVLARMAFQSVHIVGWFIAAAFLLEVQGFAPLSPVASRHGNELFGTLGATTTVASPERLSATTIGTSSSSILPPLPELKKRPNASAHSSRNKRRSGNSTNDYWSGHSIPETIPKLSDVMNRVETQIPVKPSTRPSQRRSTVQLPSARLPSSPQPSQPLRNFQTKEANEKPWKAGYYTSIKSQKKIQDAAKLEPHKKQHPIERATAVLETFLSLSPTRCNAANVVCALTLSAKVMGCQSNDTFRSLLYRTCDILGQLLHEKSLSARQLCNVAWALAKHADRDDCLLPVAPTAAALSVEEQNKQQQQQRYHAGIAETWDLRFDLAGCPAQRVDETIDTIATQLTALLDADIGAAKEGELCMASWAYGILRRRRRPPGWKHGPQLGRLSSSMPEAQSSSTSHLIKFEQWEADNVDDGPVTYNVDSVDDTGATGALLDAIGRALCAPLEPLDTLPLVNGEKVSVPPKLVVSLCTWSELANVAWAFASHGQSKSPEALALLSAISAEASSRLTDNGFAARQAQSRDISQIIWSLGTLQTDNFRFGDGLIQLVDAVSACARDGDNDRAVNDFKTWSCADIVQVILALAHARLDELPLIRALYGEALARLEQGDLQMTSRVERDKWTFQVWEVSVLLWAQARFYLTDSQGLVFGAFARRALTLLNSARQRDKSLKGAGIGLQEQANIAWSITVLELYENINAIDLLGAIFAEAAASFRDQGVIQLEHAHQLWQALYLLEDDYPAAVASVPDWFRNCLREKWNIEKSRPKISSARHMALSETLKLMGVAHFNEHDEDIDVAIILKPNACWTHETEKSSLRNGVKVAVEFDGPNHFTRQRLKATKESKPEPPRALGHSVLKYRLLKKQGWTVVRIPYYEFDKIPFWASMERQRYLQRQLKTHGNIRFSAVDISEYKAQIPNRGSRFD